MYRNRTIGQQVGQRERRLARFLSSMSLAAAALPWTLGGFNPRTTLNHKSTACSKPGTMPKEATISRTHSRLIGTPLVLLLALLAACNKNNAPNVKAVAEGNDTIIKERRARTSPPEIQAHPDHATPDVADPDNRRGQERSLQGDPIIAEILDSDGKLVTIKNPYIKRHLGRHIIGGGDAYNVNHSGVDLHEGKLSYPITWGSIDTVLLRSSARMKVFALILKKNGEFRMGIVNDGDLIGELDAGGSVTIHLGDLRKIAIATGPRDSDPSQIQRQNLLTKGEIDLSKAAMTDSGLAMGGAAVFPDGKSRAFKSIDHIFITWKSGAGGSYGPQEFMHLHFSEDGVVDLHLHPESQSSDSIDETHETQRASIAGKWADGSTMRFNSKKELAGVKFTQSP